MFWYSSTLNKNTKIFVIFTLEKKFPKQFYIYLKNSFIYLSRKNLAQPKNVSQSLFVKQFYFSTFQNNFFYTQLVFVFHLQEYFYVICKRIDVFCFYLLQKDFYMVHDPFFIFDKIWQINFQAFLYMRKKNLYKNRLNYFDLVYFTLSSMFMCYSFFLYYGTFSLLWYIFIAPHTNSHLQRN